MKSDTTTTTQRQRAWSRTNVLLLLLLLLVCLWGIPVYFSVVSQGMWLPQRYSDSGTIPTQRDRLNEEEQVLGELWYNLSIINATHRDTNVTNVTSCIMCEQNNTVVIHSMYADVIVSNETTVSQTLIYTNDTSNTTDLSTIITNVSSAVQQLQQEVDNFQCNNCTLNTTIFQDQGTWDNTTTYNETDYVFHNGSYWVSMTDGNVGTEPGTDYSAWSLYGIAGPPGPPGGIGPPGPPGNNGTSYPNGTAGDPGQLGIIPTTPWVNGTPYNEGQVVTYFGESYVALVNATTDAPTNTSEWLLYVWKGATGGPGGPGPQGPAGDLLEPSTAWNDTAAYVPGNSVTYLGFTYVASQANTNSTPDTNSTAWAIIGALGPAGGPGNNGTDGGGGCANLQADYVQPNASVPVQIMADLLDVQEGQAVVVVDAGFYTVVSGSIVNLGNGSYTYNLTYANASTDISIAPGNTVSAPRCIYTTSAPLPGPAGPAGNPGANGTAGNVTSASYVFASICTQERDIRSKIANNGDNEISFVVLDQINATGSFTSYSLDGYTGTGISFSTSSGSYTSGQERLTMCSVNATTNTSVYGRCCSAYNWTAGSQPFYNTLNINNGNTISRLTLAAGLWRISASVIIRRCVPGFNPQPSMVMLSSVSSPAVPSLTFGTQYANVQPDPDPSDTGQLHNLVLDSWIQLPVAQTFRITVNMRASGALCGASDIMTNYLYGGYLQAMQFNVASTNTV